LTYCGARARLKLFDIRLKALAVGAAAEPVVSCKWKNKEFKMYQIATNFIVIKTFLYKGCIRIK